MTFHTPASIGERLLANILDTFMLLVPSGLIAALLGGENAAVLGTFTCSLAYYVYFTSGSWQATPGKRIMGIHVIRLDGRKLLPRDALERFLAYVIPSLPMYTSLLPEGIAPLIVLWLSLAWFTPILFTAERIGYHDRLCGTRVVAGKVEV
jgi:uncharacterized RDD family membrane protein YckC